MKLPTTWDGWATKVSVYAKEGKKLLGLPRFPIKIEEIAPHFTQSIFPEDPITMIRGEDFGGRFEGALFPNSSRDEWAILYDKGHASKGRRNFTQAHEFAHYLVHRRHTSKPFQCSRRDMWEWNTEYGRMEAEANSFAAFVLMPPDDFREQTRDFRRPTLPEFETLKNRYEVSLTAVVLNWLKSTRSRAMIVVSRDGFIDWSWASPALLASGVYFKPKAVTTPVPELSLAALGPTDGRLEVQHPAGVWSRHESVLETVVFSEYHEMTISLLIYPANGSAPRKESETSDILQNR